MTVSLKRNFTGAQRILGCFCQPFRGPWATDYYCTTNFYCASIKDGLMLYDLRPAFKESFSSIYLCSSRSLLCSQRNLAEICFDSLVNKETFLDTLFILFGYMKCGTLVSLSGIEPEPFDYWKCSLNHWTTR